MPPDTQPGELSLNEHMWVEIIRTVEDLYANLANAQTALERRAEELRLANEFISNIIRSVADALIVCNTEGRVTVVSESCPLLLGHSETDLLGTPLARIFRPGVANAVHPDAPLWRTLLASGALRNLETELLTKGGEAIPVDLSASVMRDDVGDVVGVVLVATNLQKIKSALRKAEAKAEELQKAYAELTELQARLIQSEKMSSLGRMAAGVAHEINNPLGGILVYAHLLLENAPEGSYEAQTLQKVIRETTRCKDIVKGLLGFARTKQVERQALDLGKVVMLAYESVKVQPLFAGIVTELDLAADPLVVAGEEGPLQQAFINVMVNGAEAMGGNGTLRVRTWRDEAAGTASVAISDTGPGLPQGQGHLVFEPFFTTKQPGKGTGLGLAITYGVVRQHAGSITAQNGPGPGATFTLTFPLVRGDSPG